jgi:hypothetical protein
MRFLKLKSTAPRANGAPYKHALVVDAPRRFAPSNQRTETSLSRQKNHLIEGAHDSGKTRWLSRLHEHWAEIWGAKIQQQPLYLSAIEPISDWIDAPHVEAWWAEVEYERVIATDQPPRRWRSLSQKHKLQALSDYLQANKTLLFLDDAHHLTGRKLQIARQCILAAKYWIISCNAENRLPPTLRTIIERGEPQRTRLDSDASYDATKILMWLLIVSFAAAGIWEAAIILGGLKMLGTGRRATRDD